MPNPYGPSINLENAKKAVAPALAEARKNNWTVSAARGGLLHRYILGLFSAVAV